MEVSGVLQLVGFFVWVCWFVCFGLFWFFCLVWGFFGFGGFVIIDIPLKNISVELATSNGL